MGLPKFMWLGAVIAAHPNRKVVGRIRLQKTIKLLQRKGLEADYDFTLYHYGPFSAGVQSDIGLLENFELVREEKEERNSRSCYTIKASKEFEVINLGTFKQDIKLLAKTDSTVLELAATYDYYREAGHDHAEALRRLKLKKEEKCTQKNLDKALRLLEDLTLPFS